MGPLKQALKELPQPAARPPETPSIAVLPFANLSADKENEYFSDGLAEEMLIALSQVEGLRVAARSSSFSFKGKNTEMSEIASKLHVANVLDGSVRRAGNRVRVTVQLVDARNGFQLWSERYDRQMEDIFAVQDEIAHAIADQLKLTLGAAVKPATQNLEAYELYLKGRHLCSQRSPSSVRLGMKCFQQALEFDPCFALAWSGLADCYGILRVYGWISHEEAQPPALAAVTKAVELAPELWEVNFSRAIYAFYFVTQLARSRPALSESSEINPRSSLAHAYYGIFLALDRRPEEALAHVTLAYQLDPLSPFIHGLASLSFVNAGQFELGVAARSAVGGIAGGLPVRKLGQGAVAVSYLTATRRPLKPWRRSSSPRARRSTSVCWERHMAVPGVAMMPPAYCMNWKTAAAVANLFLPSRYLVHLRRLGRHSGHSPGARLRTSGIHARLQSYRNLCPFPR